MELSLEVKRALDYSGRIVVFTDNEGRMQYVNKAFITKYGYSEDEVIGQNPKMLNTGYHDKLFYSDLWRTISNGEVWEGVFRNKSKFGDYIWEKACISPVKDDDGLITGYLAIKEDITHERSIASQIEKDHYFLEELFANSPVGIAIVEPIYNDQKKIDDLLIIKANPSAGRYIERLGLVGLTVKELLPAETISDERIKIMLYRKFSFESHLKDIGKYVRFRSFPFGKEYVCLFFYDVTQYLSMIKALEASEERYFRLVEDSPATICRFDKEGVLKYVNNQFCHLHDLSHSELIGRNFLDLLPGNERDGIVKCIHHLTPEDSICEGEFQLESADGKEMWMHWLIRALVNSKGRIFEYQYVGVDITKVKQTEDKLKRLNNTKDKLFSIIAHDVKNPFNAVLGFSSLLKNNMEYYSQEQVKEYVGRILSASENVYKILDDLLVWAKTQLGQITVIKSEIRLNSIVVEAIDSFSIHAKEKGIKIINEVDNATYVSADHEMIRFVVRNLLHNGIKFTKEEGCVKFTSYSNGKYEILIVKDDGIGIKGDKLKNLFDLSGFVETSGTAKEKGSGLGLTLSKDLIEKNGGKIEVTSVEGMGSEFKIFLPKV